MTDISSRLASYKYYKALGVFQDELFRLFAPRKKPHYVQLNIGGVRMWMAPLDSCHHRETTYAEVEMYGRLVKFPNQPSQPKIQARFVMQGHRNRVGILNYTEAYRSAVMICGQPFVLVNWSCEDLKTGQAIFEFEWTQGFGYASHIQQREECRRIQHNFRPQAVFGTPEFESEKYKWQDRHNWSPRNRKRPVKLSYEVDLHYDYDYDADEYE